MTGAAGFIGSHLVDGLLADGWEVVGVDNFDPWYDVTTRWDNLGPARRSPRFSLVVRDLLDDGRPEWLDGAAVVFHLAGRPGVQDSWGPGFTACCRANVEATQRVLEQALTAGTGRVVLASSSSVYGLTAASERPSLAPVSPYGASKAAAEHLAGVYRSRGLDVVVLRYFTVFGPRQRPDMAFHRLFASVLGGPAFRRRGSGRQRREFTSVSDVVAATMCAGASEEPGVTGATFDVGGGTVTSLDDVIDAIGAVTGRACLVEDEPAAAGDPDLTRADTAALHRLGWRPQLSLGDGLERQWRWHRQRVDASPSADALRPVGVARQAR